MTGTVECQVAEQLANRERVQTILAETGGEIIHPDHYEVREAIRLAVLRSIDETTEDLGLPKMSDSELPALFRALDPIAERVFLKSIGL